VSEETKATRKKTRSDYLRRRPEAIRYYGIVVTSNGISHWTAHGALKYLTDREDAGLLTIHTAYISDVVTGDCYECPVPVRGFMSAWQAHYNDPDWNFKEWLDSATDPE
jgi:hypothetical protein